ncbi:MAG: efflux RND transporter periplasmic adaptor subunit [Pseudomonadota bacterium]
MQNNTPTEKKLSIPARIIIIFLILACASGVAVYWLKNRPRAERKIPEYRPALVRTIELRPADHQTTVHAMGTVIPSQSIDLAARIAGDVVRISPEFLPGGRFAAGAEILHIDPVDYELAVEQRKGEVARMEYELKLEIGKQSVARREYQLLGETVTRDNEELILRGPQLKAAQAALLSTKASLAKAELDLQRTHISSPFNGLVLEKYVGLGSQVGSGTKLAALVDTDEYWVKVAVPMDRLARITIPGAIGQAGSPARITNLAGWGENAFRNGTVKSLLAGVDPENRMAGLLIAVPDPLCLTSSNKDRPRLTINTFVDVEIDGNTLAGVYEIPREALHEGRRVWIMTSENTLNIRQIDIIWSEEKTVFAVGNLQDGERLITSSLPAPVEGMELRAEQHQNKTEQQ